MPPVSSPRQPRWWTKVTRDLVLFAVGVGLTINEAILRSGPERPSLLIIFAGMMGLPAVLRFDERRRKDEQ